MADSQDKLTPSDVAKLAELEKSLAKEKAVSPLTKKKACLSNRPQKC